MATARTQSNYLRSHSQLQWVWTKRQADNAGIWSVQKFMLVSIIWGSMSCLDWQAHICSWLRKPWRGLEPNVTPLLPGDCYEDSRGICCHEHKMALIPGFGDLAGPIVSEASLLYTLRKWGCVIHLCQWTTFFWSAPWFSTPLQSHEQLLTLQSTNCRCSFL